MAVKKSLTIGETLVYINSAVLRKLREATSLEELFPENLLDATPSPRDLKRETANPPQLDFLKDYEEPDPNEVLRGLNLYDYSDKRCCINRKIA